MESKPLQRFKPISISLSPNVQKDDVILALKLLFQPWKWQQGGAIKNFENEFKKYLGVKYAFSFNSGRSSLYAILKALELPQGSNVLLQAFTCNAVPNPILWAGLNPIYADCNDDFNSEVVKLSSYMQSIFSSQLAAKNFPNSSRLHLLENKVHKVRIVQHTFGLPAKIDKTTADEIIIEDCAHALGAQINGNPSTGLRAGKVGTFGNAAFFSFSRDKVISSVYGGMAVTNDDELAKKLEVLQKEFGQPSLFWIKQQLLHPILLYFFILPLYHFFDLGKMFLVLSQWLHLLSKAVHWKEKRGLRPDYFPKALPNALAMMAQNQFNKLEIFNKHRKEIAEFYYRELAGTKFGLPVKENNIFLRFTVIHPKAHEIIYDAWHKENILLGDWYTSVIAPDDTKLSEMRYQLGQCPNAERLSKITLNLPTHINISMEDAKRIVEFLKKWK